GLQGEYWALRGKNSPETEYIPPEQFEPYVELEVVTPPKTVYAYGEELDLSGCMVQRRGVDALGNEWEDEPVLLTEAENISHSVYFEPEYAGDYSLSIWTDTDYYAYTSASVKLTVSQPVGEYYLSSGSKSEVYASQLGGEPTMTIGEGTVVNVTECYGKLGRIESETFTGWADVSKMTRVTSSAEREKGDIDGSGRVNKYDAAQLGAALKNAAGLPEGISMLTAAEKDAADMNSDGKVDEADLIALLAAIQ
ncbi:MAG: dockerin type I repeat-containing protein, partial [Ruminococcus sp.]|nr:dockerin type I repeat-containing protein [Ruminococcus sp.]